MGEGLDQKDGLMICSVNARDQPLCPPHIIAIFIAELGQEHLLLGSNAPDQQWKQKDCRDQTYEAAQSKAHAQDGCDLSKIPWMADKSVRPGSDQPVSWLYSETGGVESTQLPYCPGSEEYSEREDDQPCPGEKPASWNRP